MFISTVTEIHTISRRIHEVTPQINPRLHVVGYLPMKKNQHHGFYLQYLAVADLGFLREEVNPRGTGANLIFSKFFAKNCIKMKYIPPLKIIKSTESSIFSTHDNN